LKTRVYPEGVSNGQQPESPQPETSLAAPSSHFIPGFVRRRPIRAVLLAAAVFAIPYSLARHQDRSPRTEPVSAPAPATPAGLSKALPLSPVAIENVPGNGSSRTSWNPPVGMDRTNEVLDQLTMDFTSGPQPAPDQPASRQTPEQPPRFQAGTRVTSVDAAQPAPAQEGPVGPPVAAPPAAADAPAALPAKPRVAKARQLDAVDQYLWSVYQRSTTKRDSSGDFTWKDEAAAAHLGLVTKQYVIGGMDPDFRELLYNLGHAMDTAGLNWTILSGFRDDYRQGLASGYKAHAGNSFHGGSRATGGYGHGCAADIEASDGESSSNSAVWKWVDQHGEKFGIYRPMRGIDPAHVQPSGAWHDIAFNLRDKRITAENGYLPASVDPTGSEKITPLVDTRSGVSEAQYDCVRSRHRSDFRLAGFSHHPRFTMGGRMHRAMLFHPRMHRFGRRRMVVETRGPDRRADAETETVMAALQAGNAAEVTANFSAKTSATKSSDAGNVAEGAEKHAKAQASDRYRRDARRNKVADTERPEKHPGTGKKEASVKADQTPRKGDLRLLEVLSLGDRRHADDKHSQRRAAADSSTHRAKAKSHVADQDAPDKNDKKL
jgi:hypothetical protein